MNSSPMLGILGGLGPMSTVCFYEMLTARTEARTDREHIDIVISSRATTPDRTAYILGRSDLNPLPVMIEDARRLVAYGANLLAVPCNTAHFFYDALRAAVSVPIINIIEETVKTLHTAGIRRFGLLATEGTARSEAYARVSAFFGVECLLPTPEEQEILSSIIYDEVKQNHAPNPTRLEAVSSSLLARGCEKLVLGCTELSLLKPHLQKQEDYLDALEVLALRTILACGKTPIGFSDPLLRCGKEVAHEI